MNKTRVEKLQSLEEVVRAALKELGKKDAIKCGFCYQDQDKVKKIIACDPVYICDECVQVCIDILKDAEEKEKKMKVHSWPEIENVGKVIQQKMEEIGKGDE